MSRFCVLPSRVLDDERIGMTHLRVMAVLGMFTDKNGWCYPSASTIAERVRVSRQRVSACIQDLKTWGYVEVHGRVRNTDGGQTSNAYRVLFDVGLPEEGFGGDSGGSEGGPGGDPVGPMGTPPCNHTLHPLQPLEVAPPATPRGCTKNDPSERKKKKEDTRARKIDFDGVAFSGIEADQIQLWQSAYPAIDVEGEIRKAAAWLNANPANRKSDYKRFLNNWLARAQDRAPRVQSVAQTAAGQRPAAKAAPAGDPFDPFNEQTWGRDRWGNYCPQKYLADKRRAFFARQAAQPAGSQGDVFELEVVQ